MQLDRQTIRSSRHHHSIGEASEELDHPARIESLCRKHDRAWSIVISHRRLVSMAIQSWTADHAKIVSPEPIAGEFVLPMRTVEQQPIGDWHHVTIRGG